ncbi:MAG: hypothetical protein RIR33_2204 [Pseudomonadota bacterium]|jgi:hypothetical protein
MMAAQKTEAVRFLKSTIFRYSDQLQQIRAGGRPSAEVVIDKTRVAVSEDQLEGLIADARALLAKLG